MITFKEFLAEGYQRRKKVDASGIRGFCYDVEDAIWEKLKPLKINKEELLIECSVSDHWDNYLLTKFQAAGHPTVFKPVVPRDWVKVRLDVNKAHRKETHDAHLLFRVLSKHLEPTLSKFFGRFEPFITNEIVDRLDAGGKVGSSHIDLRWHVWDPKWLP